MSLLWSVPVNNNVDDANRAMVSLIGLGYLSVLYIQFVFRLPFSCSPVIFSVSKPATAVLSLALSNLANRLS